MILAINILAIMLSPLIAILVTQHLERYRAKISMRRNVLQAMLANRHAKTLHESIQTVNIIELAFYDCEGVRKLFREYLDMLGNKGLTSDPNGWVQIDEKFGELATAMAKHAGLARHMSYQDMMRVYTPKALEDNARRQDELAQAMIAFFRASIPPDRPGDVGVTNVTESAG